MTEGGVMVRLIGREKEMGELESFLSDEAVRGCAVYGIRQVGKTTMLRRIASAYKSVYIQAVKGSEKAIVEVSRIPWTTNPRRCPGFSMSSGGYAWSPPRW